MNSAKLLELADKLDAMPKVENMDFTVWKQFEGRFEITAEVASYFFDLTSYVQTEVYPSDIADRIRTFVSDHQSQVS